MLYYLVEDLLDLKIVDLLMIVILFS
jgi:hypothetical protein